jgi:beta-glucuronidase
VHGVVDVYGRRKPSYDVLREEASPVATLSATLAGNELKVAGRTCVTVPGYTLRGYTLEAVVYGQGNIPVERQRLPLPDLVPGSAIAHTFTLSAKDALEVRVELKRATGWSARTAIARR